MVTGFVEVSRSGDYVPLYFLLDDSSRTLGIHAGHREGNGVWRDGDAAFLHYEGDLIAVPASGRTLIPRALRTTLRSAESADAEDPPTRTEQGNGQRVTIHETTDPFLVSTAESVRERRVTRPDMPPLGTAYAAPQVTPTGDMLRDRWSVHIEWLPHGFFLYAQQGPQHADEALVREWARTHAQRLQFRRLDSEGILQVESEDM